MRANFFAHFVSECSQALFCCDAVVGVVFSLLSVFILKFTSTSAFHYEAEIKDHAAAMQSAASAYQPMGR